MEEAKVKIWIASELEKILHINKIKASVTLKPVRGVVHDFLETAGVNDIVILPFFSSFLQLATKIRQHGNQGPIIFITTDAHLSDTSEEALENGVLLLKYGRLKGDDLIDFINFMIFRENDKKSLHDRLIALEQLGERDVDGLNSVGEEDQLKSGEQESPTEIEGDQILPVMEQLLEHERRILFSFNYMMKYDKKTVAVNLTSKLRKISDGGYVVLDSIQPRVNLTDLLKTGYPVILSFEHAGNFLTCKTAIKTVKENRVVSVDLPDRIVPQKRKYFRVEPTATDELLVHMRAPTTSTYSTELVDISERGFAFLFNDVFAEGDELLAFITINEDHILCKGIVRSKTKINGLFRYGVESHPYASDVDALMKFILRKQIEIISQINREQSRPLRR